MQKFYLDTSIWIDLINDRIGFNEEPLGKYAWELLSKIKSNEDKIVISDLVIAEFKTYLKEEEIFWILNLFKKNIEKIKSTEKQKFEAKVLSHKLNLPFGDVLHSIIARDNKLILITRDNHFKKLTTISKFYKPEDLI